VREEQLDEQVLALFDSLRIEDEQVRHWFLSVLRARVRETQKDTESQTADINRQLASLRDQQDRLLNLRLLNEIDESTFATKNTELKDRVGHLSLQLEAFDRGRAERGEIAEKAFELSQSLRQKWFKADVRAKRQLLEIVCLNFSLEGASLVPTIRKPFDVLAEGPSIRLSRGGRI
jgi:site-specific DNA recombinase